jgi:hypothetical protein
MKPSFDDILKELLHKKEYASERRINRFIEAMKTKGYVDSYEYEMLLYIKNK